MFCTSDVCRMTGIRDYQLAYLHAPGLAQPLCMKLAAHGMPLRAGESVHVVLPPQHGLLFDAVGVAFARRAAEAA